MEFSLKDAFRYPFKNFRSFWNFLWIFLPVIGWFFLYGYFLQILGSVATGKDKALPKSIGFWTNFVEGLKFLVYLVPLYIVLGLISWLAPGWVYVLLSLFAGIPYIYLTPRYAVSRKFQDLYDFPIGWAMIFSHFGDVVLFIVFYIVLAVVWGIASILIITLVITLPALSYGTTYLEAKLYARASPKKSTTKKSKK
ncbi:MAG: DUF4013 domain-containing protein [DPANN group archaeon]|nr:DUF4013 domain-containing protein [DPANN group archaeon]